MEITRSMSRHVRSPKKSALSTSAWQAGTGRSLNLIADVNEHALPIACLVLYGSAIYVPA